VKRSGTSQLLRVRLIALLGEQFCNYNNLIQTAKLI
jgi:hypothetical protein